jgi:hypothetical protein
MHLMIPHPMADFDEHTPFVFYNSDGAELPRILTAGNGVFNSDLSLYGLNRADKVEADRVLRVTRSPGAGRDSYVSFNRDDHMVGLPLSTVTEHGEPQTDINLHHLFTTDNYSALMCWESRTTRKNVQNARNVNYGAPDNDYRIVGHTPRPTNDYFKLAPDTVANPHEAWNRCSDSWKAWAKASPVDTRILLWHAVVTFPRYFGFESPEQLQETWITTEIHNLSPCTRSRANVLAAGAKFTEGSITLYRDERELESGKPATLRIGKAVRLMMHEPCDADVKNVTSAITGEMVPPEFKIGFEKADFDLAYTKGPSSCMTYKADKYYLLSGGTTDLRPTDALINGDIGVAMFTVDGTATARTLIVHSSKKWVRIYTADYATQKNNGSALKAKLQAEGYTEDTRALCGQHLVKIPIPVPANEGNAAMQFGVNPSDLNARFRNVLGIVTPSQIGKMKEVMDLRAYIAPFIDASNPALIEHDDYLLVDDGEYENVDNNVFYILEIAKNKTLPRLGRTQYQCGGLVTMDYAAVINAWKETSEAPEVQEEVIAATRTENPDLESLCDDIINLIDCRDPFEDLGTTWACYHPGTQTQLPGLTTDEAEQLSMTLTNCAEVDGLVWVKADLVYEFDDEYYLEEDHEHFGHVYIESRSEWYQECDCSVLHNGEWAHDNDTVTLACGDRYLEDDEDIRFVENEGEYYHQDDVVIDIHDEYQLAENCFELPNGGFIHEDDLQRAG